MPNWCFTQMTVTGPKEELSRFRSPLTVNPETGYCSSILEQYVPCPQELKETLSGFMGDNNPGKEDWEAQKASNIAKYGHPDWYGWSCDNWGSKWSDCNTIIQVEEEEKIVFSFETAWSPIEEGIQKVSEIFPDLLFLLDIQEESGEYEGIIVIAEGNTIYEDTFSGHEIYNAVEEKDPDNVGTDEFYDECHELREKKMVEVHAKFEEWKRSLV